MKRPFWWSSIQKLRYLLLSSLVFNLFGLLLGARKMWNYYQENPFSPPSTASLMQKYIQDKNQYYLAHPVKEGDIVFVGNSLTDNFRFTEYYGNIKNRGIRGDNSSNLLERIESIAMYHPKKIFIEIGINDIGYLEDPGNILLSNYARIIEKIQSVSPTTDIHVLSLTPLTENNESSPKLSHKNTRILHVNKELKKLCTIKKVVYLDFYTPFGLKGELNPAFTDDGIHLKDEGYTIWAKLLAPYVIE